MTALSPEDRLAVIDVVGRWAHAADGGDVGAFADIMTDGASYTVAGEQAITDRAAIAAAVTARSADEQPRRHVRNTIFVEADADRCLTRSYYLLTVSAGGGRPQPHATGVYADEVVRTADGWRIRSRVAEPDRSAAVALRA